MRLRNVKNKEEILSSCSILIRELEDLKGRELLKGYDVSTIIKY